MAQSKSFFAVGVLGGLGLALTSMGDKPQNEKPRPVTVPVAQVRAAPRPVEVSYADTLRKGETLSELMGRTRLNIEEARALLSHIEAVQDVRKVRPGLVLRYTQATFDGLMKRAELGLDADHVLSVEAGKEGLAARVAEVKVSPDTAVLAGTVKSSLYQALMEGAGDVPSAERQQIADVLADQIFAWKLDFSSDLRSGDSFRIVYERMARPDGTARSGRVLAVQFEVGGKLQEAYLFRQHGRDDYFDGDGESLRRAFLRAPLEFRRISSTFSAGRYHPILHRMRAHKGVDFAASRGTPVRAVGDGVVARAGWSGGIRQRGAAPSHARLRQPLRAPLALRRRHPRRHPRAPGRRDRLRGEHRALDGARTCTTSSTATGARWTPTGSSSSPASRSWRPPGAASAPWSSSGWPVMDRAGSPRLAMRTSGVRAGE
jgi:murein DD-endopeptidase MepM/ murein hydrolase activator NlpD